LDGVSVDGLIAMKVAVKDATNSASLSGGMVDKSCKLAMRLEARVGDVVGVVVCCTSADGLDSDIVGIAQTR
jgi:hypothetical protein